ncbi:ABC transporter ATP-binding protein [Desulfobulbus alkaliphilus]|uniref:ABC transporter ATP-binding protein n=1 Tax=Desulfobulbus alkaliphilus TaxID=869814 RepID=UPI0019651147|nr:ATP-binding cassette domain-containing protein [Desulfobulbus alkaliphilus]MBM9535690.1 ATP-binding cassette domain-containing protein [Desulfobulbus alkaliphilus]
MALELRQITKRFGRIKALDDVSITIENGALVCFLGPSGCGKTTLLRVIAGLERPDSGDMRLAGRNLFSVPARKRNFGVVFQSYSLFPNMTIAANVAYGLECRQWRKKDIVQRVEEMLEMVHLKDQAEKFPHQLSGGQQQRIALARALAPKPEMLLLDEPLSALDAKVREELRGEIRLLQQHLGITTIMVTHDQEEALTMADIIVVMQNGRVMQSGPPMILYQQPENRFVAEFLGRMNVVPAGLGVPVPIGTHPTGGQPRILGIRPEDIRLVSDQKKNGHLAGVIDQVTRLGNLTRVTVRVQANNTGCHPDEGWCNGETLRIVAEMQGVHEDLRVGMPGFIDIPFQSVRVLEWQ